MILSFAVSCVLLLFVRLFIFVCLLTGWLNLWVQNEREMIDLASSCLGFFVCLFLFLCSCVCVCFIVVNDVFVHWMAKWTF